MEIKLIKNTFFNEAITKEKLCAFIIQSEKLSMGDWCLKAENEFAKLMERRYCLLFNSGSSANLALVQAYLNLGRLKKGDRVGFSSLTWSTNVMPLIQLGLVPVPIDVNLELLNVDSYHLEKTIETYSLQAFFGTNILGFAGDMEKIAALCKTKNILFFEDNCESLGSRYKGTLLGNFGNAATYSFYVGHHFSTIEGGAVCTNDHELYTTLLLCRAHGWDRNLPEKEMQEIRTANQVSSPFYAKYTFYDVGYNLRPTEITGFLLLENITHYNDIVSARQNNFNEIYNAVLDHFGDAICKFKTDQLEVISNFAIPIVCKTKELFEKMTNTLMKDGVEIRPVVTGNIVSQPFFKKYLGNKYAEKDFPNCTIIHEQGFYIGNNPDLTREEIHHIKTALTSIEIK